MSCQSLTRRYHGGLWTNIDSWKGLEGAGHTKFSDSHDLTQTYTEIVTEGSRQTEAGPTEFSVSYCACDQIVREVRLYQTRFIARRYHRNRDTHSYRLLRWSRQTEAGRTEFSVCYGLARRLLCMLRKHFAHSFSRNICHWGALAHILAGQSLLLQLHTYNLSEQNTTIELPRSQPASSSLRSSRSCAQWFDVTINMQP